MRHATYSTDDPPVKIDNPELAEYVTALRRRIEVQNDFMENYVSQSTHATKSLIAALRAIVDETVDGGSINKTATEALNQAKSAE